MTAKTMNVEETVDFLPEELKKRGWQTRVLVQYKPKFDRGYSYAAKRARRFHPNQTGVLTKAF